MKAEETSKTFADVPPNLAFVAIGVAGVVYFGCKWLGSAEAGRVAGYSIGVLIGVVAMCRPLWKERWFWMAMASIVLLHILVIILGRWPEIHYPTLLMAPFAFVDFFVIIKLIEVLDKRIRNVRSRKTSARK